MRNRKKILFVYLSQMEEQQLNKALDATGLTASAYIRKLIMQREIRPRPPDEYAKLLRELSAIGNNINQLAYKANGLGIIHLAEVRRMREALEKIYSEVKNG